MCHDHQRADLSRELGRIMSAIYIASERADELQLPKIALQLVEVGLDLERVRFKLLEPCRQHPLTARPKDAPDCQGEFPIP
jgi:hypothetical protein